MATYTAFCREDSGLGTIWIDTVDADTLDEALKKACEACATAWGYEIETVECIGLAKGDVEIPYWSSNA